MISGITGEKTKHNRCIYENQSIAMGKNWRVSIIACNSWQIDYLLTASSLAFFNMSTDQVGNQVGSTD